MKMQRPRCDIFRAARSAGVILREAHEHSPASRKPRECFCKPTLKEICHEHGEDHLKLVLMLMTGSKQNSAELYSDLIKAVSSVLARNEDLVRRAGLVDEFNCLDLSSIRKTARRLKIDITRTDLMKVLLTQMLYPSWREAA